MTVPGTSAAMRSNAAVASSSVVPMACDVAESGGGAGSDVELDGDLAAAFDAADADLVFGRGGRDAGESDGGFGVDALDAPGRARSVREDQARRSEGCGVAVRAVLPRRARPSRTAVTPAVSESVIAAFRGASPVLVTLHFDGDRGLAWGAYGDGGEVEARE